MSCWYCHWGWAKPVADIYDEAVKRLNLIGSTSSVLHYSASHIVWEDENFDQGNRCIENFDEWNKDYDYNSDELQIVRWSLEELSKLPYEVRCISPEDRDIDYGDKGVEDFPPDVKTVIR